MFLRIPPAFISSVSNQKVFEQAGVKPLSKALLVEQMLFLRKVSLAPPSSCLRRAVFVGDTFMPQLGRFVRRVGRPRQAWSLQIMEEGRRLLGCHNFDAF